MDLDGLQRVNLSPRNGSCLLWTDEDWKEHKELTWEADMRREVEMSKRMGRNDPVKLRELHENWAKNFKEQTGTLATHFVKQSTLSEAASVARRVDQAYELYKLEVQSIEETFDSRQVLGEADPNVVYFVGECDRL